MEKQTAFSLNREIQEWRRSLAESVAFRGTDLDELEAHLLDSLPALQAAGLSPEEAFLVASRRIGPLHTLEPEFSKINKQSVWLKGLIWVCVTIQAWLLLYELPLTFGARILGAAAILLWSFLIVSPRSPRVVEGILARPATAGVGILLLSLGHKTWVAWSLWFRLPQLFANHQIDLSWQSKTGFLGVFLWRHTHDVVVACVLIAVMAVARRQEKERILT